MADALTLEEKRARIEQLRADIELKYLDRLKRDQDLRFAPWQLVLAGVTAAATLIGASVGSTLAIVKLVGG
jgi:hypothetical protein